MVEYVFLLSGGRAHSTMDCVLALHPAAPGLILGTPVPRLIEYCLVSGHWDTNKPILYEAGVRKSSWSAVN